MYKMVNICYIAVCVIKGHVQTTDIEEQVRTIYTLVHRLGKQWFIGDFVSVNCMLWTVSRKEIKHSKPSANKEGRLFENSALGEIALSQVLVRECSSALTYLLTYLLTYSMVQSPSWETKWLVCS